MSELATKEGIASLNVAMSDDVVERLTLVWCTMPSLSLFCHFCEDPATLEEGLFQNLSSGYCWGSEELELGILVSARIWGLTRVYLNADALSHFFSATLISKGMVCCIVLLLCKEHHPTKLHLSMHGQFSTQASLIVRSRFLMLNSLHSGLKVDFKTNNSPVSLMVSSSLCCHRLAA